MTRIDFYVLNDKNTQQDRFHFACRLTEKAVKQGNQVLIATEDEASARLMNELLWSFSPESFVPHAIVGGKAVGSKAVGGEAAASVPVLICYGDDDGTHHDVLLNLGLQVPDYFSRFQRVSEIVVQDAAVLAATRKNYAWYQQRGYPLTTHKL
jgi:DNA polymerase III subunit chi